MNIIEDDVVLVLMTAVHDTRRGIKAGDFLAILAATAKGELKGEYRFRYYTQPGFDGDDEISRFTLSEMPDCPEHREKVLAAFREVMRDGPFLNQREQLINGPGSALVAAMLENQNLSVKMESMP